MLKLTMFIPASAAYMIELMTSVQVPELAADKTFKPIIFTPGARPEMPG
jgi:hypothetical protein